MSMVSADRQEETWVVSFTHSELDALVSQQLAEELQSLAEKVGGESVVLNMAQVSFLQSEALGALVAFRNQLKDRGATVAVAGPTPPIRRALHITRLDVIFDVYPDLDEALAKVRGR
jgi:anti-sigma B factor antagonist